MRELRRYPVLDPPQLPVRPQCRFETDLSEANDNADSLQQFEFFEDKGFAVRNLRRRRPILRWRTTHGCSDVTINELESITAVSRRGVICKSGLVQRAEQPVAAFVSRKHPAGSVSSVSSGRKPDKKQAGMRITKAWDRFPPILLVGKPLYLLSRNLFPPAYEARAEPALNHTLAYAFKCSTAVHSEAPVAVAISRTQTRANTAN